MTPAVREDVFSCNRRVRLDPPVWVLLLLGTFGLWQMGVVFYSSTALSVNGRTPLPVDVANMAPLILAAYALSFVLLLVSQRRIVPVGRAAISLALLCAVGLFLPLPPQVLVLLVYVQTFCCVFFIGFIMAMSITLFAPAATLLYTLTSALFTGIGVPLLQNDLFQVDFRIFNALAIVILLALLAALSRLPSVSPIRFAAREDAVTPPRALRSGLYLLIFIGCLMTLFTAGFAEGVPNGTPLAYLAEGVSTVVFLWLWRRRGKNPLHLASVYIFISGVGFLLCVAAASFPPLAPVACVLMGPGLTVCVLSEFFAASLFVRYPSRFVAPAIVAIAAGTVVLHSVLLELFRTQPQTLAILYGVLAVLAVGLYLRMEPHLVYAWDRDEASAAPRAREAAPQESAAQPAIFAQLSPQERVIADLILRGFTTKEISEHMGIAVGTQKNYRKNLYSKLGIHTRKELFALAGRREPAAEE